MQLLCFVRDNDGKAGLEYFKKNWSLRWGKYPKLGNVIDDYGLHKAFGTPSVRMVLFIVLDLLDNFKMAFSTCISGWRCR